LQYPPLWCFQIYFRPSYVRFFQQTPFGNTRRSFAVPFYIQTRFVHSTLNSREHETNDIMISLLMETCWTSTCKFLILHKAINAVWCKLICAQKRRNYLTLSTW
jgi:hypothetical protein